MKVMFVRFIAYVCFITKIIDPSPNLCFKGNTFTHSYYPDSAAPTDHLAPIAQTTQLSNRRCCSGVYQHWMVCKVGKIEDDRSEIIGDW